jgi:hypothetical protein
MDDRASLADLRHRIDEVAIPRLIGALDIPALDADLLLAQRAMNRPARRPALSRANSCSRAVQGKSGGGVVGPYRSGARHGPGSTR